MDRFTCTSQQCESCPDQVVCRCLQITESALVQVITTLQLRTVKEVRRHTGAGDGCMCCHARLREYLVRHSCAATAIAG
jgi:bacterioferritin-associated ferredoxin